MLGKDSSVILVEQLGAEWDHLFLLNHNILPVRIITQNPLRYLYQGDQD